MRRDGIELNGVDSATYEPEFLSCWHTVAVLNNEGEREKYLPVEEAETVAAVDPDIQENHESVGFTGAVTAVNAPRQNNYRRLKRQYSHQRQN